ncbi:ER lumen protein-retaining receptor [Neolecta irregularis DAH-3]|uniref:ER lumen protein-retaining receptor n=1 Tax=Neolecta irregularis (strain DAH-3) TaxID=1198029 RepID=A0A1U7LP68_NEOID|nr:ER lumen protein-retaining receptor [Neolecta irregularis DAH-3]|eukprot:OLL24447.1 ER lumen protein-retaining receptor [Neolecta irregularis DAH-3]
MNIFRFLGDLSHLVSIWLLLHKMTTSKSCTGISFKTQALYALVFATRYLDLLYGSWHSMYNVAMKIFFIGSSLYILYLIKVPFKPTRDPAIDTFKLEYLVGGALIMSLIANYEYSFPEILWSFSIWLEAVAILPQLFIIQRTGEAENITTHYVAALGAYRGLYIPNWLYRYFAEGFFDPIAVIAGIIQTVIYLDFFYIYFTKVLKGQKFELPKKNAFNNINLQEDTETNKRVHGTNGTTALNAGAFES